MTLLACLLPVRNGAEDLPGYLESAGRFADAVIALDDGSTDATASALEASPLVKLVLSNPRRLGYAGWDDIGNRQRLLEAAAELDPAWVLFLDADERIDTSDATALRRFVERDAIPGLAYGFRVHRMIGDEARYDRAALDVFRLFAWRPGLRLDGPRVHVLPVPTAIPRRRWVPTTLRIQHLASLTDGHRRRRHEKYSQADPRREYQASYDHLLEAAGPTRPWVPRDPDAPVLVAAPRPPARRDGAPVLSAIVIARDGEPGAVDAVASAAGQRLDEPFEVIAVTSGGRSLPAELRRRFPSVRVVELAGDALPGAARNAGLAVARGSYVSFPGSHVRLPQGSLAARVRAHDLGHAMVTGTVVNGTTTPAGWASFFLDHSAALPGRPSGPLRGPPAHCSYRRDALEAIVGFREDLRAGEDTVANRELWRFGLRAHRASGVVLEHRSPCAGRLRLVRHHFVRGRALGRILLEHHGGRRRLLRARALRRYVRRRVGLTARNVADWGGDLRSDYRRVRGLVALGALAALAGAWVEVLFGAQASRATRSSRL